MKELGGDIVCKSEAKENFPVSGPRLDPKWSPDSRFVSFIRDEDIWITRIGSTEEMRLTFTHCLNKNLHAGVAEFIMQEEFDRFSGYWWSPQPIEETSD